jgi:hypothetical protein
VVKAMRFARGLSFSPALPFSPGLHHTHGPEIAPKAKCSLNLFAQFGIFFSCLQQKYFIRWSMWLISYCIVTPLRSRLRKWWL